MSLPVYLDYNATTPVDPRVVDSISVILREHFGNPSSAHLYGAYAREALSWARRQVAALLEADETEIVFTGSASEANNMAILGVARACQHQGSRHLITSAIEHPSVMAPVKALQEQGWEISILPVDRTGRVDADSFGAMLRPDTVLLSVMHANNEVGTIQPIAELAAQARQHGVLLHVDASQSVGKLPVSVRQLGADLLTLAGHKLYAPKGIGALYVRQGLTLAPLMFGAGQEQGRRTGTENVALITGLGTAARLAAQRLPVEEARLRCKRDRLHRILAAAIPGLVLNGHPEHRLPNTLHLSFPGVSGRELLQAAGHAVAASVGSACHEDTGQISAVLGAMGFSAQQARGAVRLSVGIPTTDEEIEQAALALTKAWHSCVDQTLQNPQAATV